MLKKQYSKTKPVCKVTFSLPIDAAEGAHEIKVLGDFNDWNWENGILMTAGKKDYQAVAELTTGRSYEFRYLIDSKIWANDHQADAYVPSPFAGIDNSVIVLEEVELNTTSKAKSEKKEAVAPAKAKAAKITSEKDDLKKIEGVGPKIEQLLNEQGIVTFADLAKAKISVLKDILTTAGPRFKMHDPATWTKQAKLAAAGNWNELATLQEELKGGRVK